MAPGGHALFATQIAGTAAGQTCSPCFDACSRIQRLMDQPDCITLRTRAGIALGVPEFRQSQLDSFLEDPAGLLLRNLARPVKISHEALIVEALLPVGRQVLRVALKRCRARNWWKALCGLFRPSRAIRAWRLGRTLRALGIETPRPIAACRARLGSGRATSYLAVEWIDGAEHLHQYGWRLATCPVALRLRSAAQCAESLGSLIGRMHAAGVAHRDLKAVNLLVADGEGSITTWLVDLDGVRIRRGLSSQRRVRDLARLAAGLEAHRWVTPAVCCRFLCSYAAQFPPGVIAWRQLWRDVSTISRQIAQRKRRRGEQVL